MGVVTPYYMLKRFTYVNSFIPPNKSMTEALFYPFYCWGSWGTRRLSYCAPSYSATEWHSWDHNVFSVNQSPLLCKVALLLLLLSSLLLCTTKSVLAINLWHIVNGELLPDSKCEIRATTKLLKDGSESVLSLFSLLHPYLAHCQLPLLSLLNTPWLILHSWCQCLHPGPCNLVLSFSESTCSHFCLL